MWFLVGVIEDVEWNCVVIEVGEVLSDDVVVVGLVCFYGDDFVFVEECFGFVGFEN